MYLSNISGKFSSGLRSLPSSAPSPSYPTISDVQAPECTWRSSSIGNLEISFHVHVRWRCCLSHWLASTLRPLQPLILCSSSLFKQLIRPEQLRFRNYILISHFVQSECVARKHSWK
ncbi:hypothetical protein T06_4102 [Trichinella sp. T6]|nr:hypothetical protein T06_4102 [Trichinella sp. T6]